MELDRTNKRIAAILERDARISVTEIGKQIGLSRPAVQARIAVMEEAGIIRGYHTVIRKQVGLVRALMFVEISRRPCDEALQWLLSLEGVTSLVSLAGEVDAVVSVTVPSAEDLSVLNDRVAASPFISEARSHVILREYAKA